MNKSQLNTKSLSRIAAIQTIYQYENYKGESDIEGLLLRMIEFYKDSDVRSDHELNKDSKLKIRLSKNYLQELVKFTHENIEEIDSIIQQYLVKEWTIETLPKLLHAMLRVGVCELKYFPETPRKVIINEYTDISSDMLDDGEIGFVNSVLDKYAAENG
ncbi:transcription antitermination factor NusB [Rickettsiaceae bacterium]|nr:transcription antitermination factor NusB [Rickettsiaceae bacterium]